MDHYTKIVLTVIAAALCSLVLQNAVNPSQAQSDVVQRVVICNIDGSNCAGVTGPGWQLSPAFDGSLLVRTN